MKKVKLWVAMALSLSVCLCSLSGLAGEVRFNKGQLWLSKSSQKETSAQKVQAASSSQSVDAPVVPKMTMATDRKVGKYATFGRNFQGGRSSLHAISKSY